MDGKRGRTPSPENRRRDMTTEQGRLLGSRSGARRRGAGAELPKSDRGLWVGQQMGAANGEDRAS